MFTEQVHDILVELGLSSLQAKVFCTLIHLGDPTANATSKLAKIARQEIYRIADELEEIGLVSRTVSTPVRFQPVPLNEALSILMERRIKTTSALMKKVKEIHLESANKQPKSVSSYFIKELQPGDNWFGNSPLKLNTTQTFDLLTTYDRLSSRIISDAKAFRTAAKNKTTMFRIITEEPPVDSSYLKIIDDLRIYPNFQMRFLDVKPEVILIIFNKKEAALSLSPTDSVGPPYLISTHPSFLRLALGYFESTWDKAN